MNQLSLDELMEKVGSRYTLVAVAAKRARVLTEKGADKVGGKENGVPGKPVTTALKEILGNKVGYREPRGGIK